MLTAKELYFDPRDEEEAREERLRESIFVRDVIKTIWKDTLAKARKSNQCYAKLSRDMLANINKDIGDREIKSTHYTYTNPSLVKR